MQQLYSEYKSTGLFMFRKKLGDIKGLFLRGLGMKSLSCTENTELAQVTSAKSSELKDYTSEMKRSIKYSRRLALQ